MSLSASAGATLAAHQKGFIFNTPKANANVNKNNEFLKKEEPQKQQVNPFDYSPEELSAQFAAVTNPVQSVPTETLGTMAYTGGGAEAAGTMASAGNSGSVSSVSCVA